MAQLSEREQREMLEDAQSPQLRDDCERLREQHRHAMEQSEHWLDDYLDFLNVMNELMNHQVKPFRPITGEHFLL